MNFTKNKARLEANNNYLAILKNNPDHISKQSKTFKVY